MHAYARITRAQPPAPPEAFESLRISAFASAHSHARRRATVSCCRWADSRMSCRGAHPTVGAGDQRIQRIHAFDATRERVRGS